MVVVVVVVETKKTPLELEVPDKIILDPINKDIQVDLVKVKVEILTKVGEAEVLVVLEQTAQLVQLLPVLEVLDYNLL